MSEHNNEERMKSPRLVENNSRLDMHQSRNAIDLQLRLFYDQFLDIITVDLS